MWQLVSFLVALVVLIAFFQFLEGPEKSMERLGRLAAALRRGYEGKSTPP